MKNLVFKSETEEHSEDISRKQSVCAARGFLIHREDARRAWEEYSESMAAGWIILYKDDEDLFQTVKFYTQES